MQAHKLLAIAAALLCVMHVQGSEDHSAHVKGEVIVTLPLTMAAFDTGKQTSYKNAIKAASGNNLEAVEIEEIKSNPPTDKVEVHTEIEAHDKAKFEDAEKLLKVQANVDNALVAVSLPKSTAYQFVEGDHDHSSATCMKPTPVAVLAAATAIFASALCV